MRDEIDFNGTTYVSVRTASDDTGLTRDYLARICKRGMLDARRIGAMWYLDPRSLQAFLRAQDHARTYRREALARQRAQEYREKMASRLGKPERAQPRESEPSITDQMRELVKGSTATGTAALSEAANAPGLSHAAMSIPAQALTHIPATAVTPTFELIHRIAALMTAFVMVLGVYSVFDHTYIRVAASSVHDTALRAAAGFSQLSSRSSDMAAAASASIDAAAANPEAILQRIRKLMQQTPAQLSTTDAPVALAHSAPPVVMDQLAAAGVSVTSADGTTGSAGSPIAVSVTFTGTSVSYGDLVSYNDAGKTYSLTKAANDASIYGIVVQDPALLFKPDGIPGDVPVVRSGPALVNVTLENGPIAIGDPLTSSAIPGKARRANDGEHVIGYAKEAFSGVAGVSLKAPNGGSVLSGTIPVNVTVTSSGGSANGQQIQGCTNIPCRIAAALDPKVVAALIRYIFSAVIAIITLTLAFKSFMSDANYGVISMGRNPRAKSSIQSLVFFNALLAAGIASTGLFAAMMILFAG